MPLFIAALLGALIQGAGTLVGRVLISLGIGYVTYTGIDLMLTTAKDQALSRLGGLGSTVVQLAGVLQVGTCINILASAFMARLLVKGLTDGKLTSMITKGGS